MRKEKKMNNGEDGNIYMYSDLFTSNLSDNENEDKYEKDKKKKKSVAYTDDNYLKHGENEYSKLRAENSTILNNYFHNENIKPSEHDKNAYVAWDDMIIFPVDKKYSLKLFEGELSENKHTIKLRKSGFYCIALENNNDGKWDTIYFGFSKIQIELSYKLISQNDLANAEGKERENTNNDRVPNFGKSKQSPNEDNNKSIVEEMNSISDASDNMNDMYKYTYEESEDMLDEKVPDTMRGRSNSMINNKNKLKNKNSNYHHNPMTKNRYNSKLSLDHHNTIETFRCSFNNENKTRVSSNEKKYIYIYSKDADTYLDIFVRTHMALGMCIMCKYSLLYCGKNNKIPDDPYVPFRRPVSILSLDSGGVLATSSLIVLTRIENELRKELGNDTVNLIDCFDMVCGTSAGGLISLGLLGGYSLQDISILLPHIMEKTFEGNRNIISGIFFEGYDINNVKNLFMEHIGNTFLASHKNLYCFVTATDVKHNPYKLFLLRNYTHKYNAINGESYAGLNQMPLWLAAWATASAPTYLKGPNEEDFKKYGFNIKPEIHLVDGALKASNPALIALEECARLNNKALPNFIHDDLDTLVSIGTGHSPMKLTKSGNDSTKTASTFEILINSTHLLTRANDTHREVLHWLSEKENTYFRFNVPYIGDINIDSRNTDDFDFISKSTLDYLTDEKYYDIKCLVRKLANNYIRSRYT
ncbi:phospholipase A2, putative [Plasmodium vinckei]|uniref:Phospholipase A2, putative n=1 Tax=Plasmodium vinckei TaxID=5860 RepID=A0A6V7SES0_PLAVN|nr:phospholipase A2, putative [Plasmodium vinckei]